MSEELLFEIPEVRITTERLVFHEKTFAVDYVTSTDVDWRTKEWSCWLLVAVFACVGFFFNIPLKGIWHHIAIGLEGALLVFLLLRLPRDYVLTIRMVDKKFYEVITRTRKEAEIIQGYINDAMVRKRETLAQEQEREV
jgi:hypothetical protein